MFGKRLCMVHKVNHDETPMEVYFRQELTVQNVYIFALYWMRIICNLSRGEMFTEVFRQTTKNSDNISLLSFP